MRQEVRIGLAIGGVLLAVLIAYVLVVPGPEKAPTNLSTDGTAPTPVAVAPVEPPAPVKVEAAAPTTAPVTETPRTDLFDNAHAAVPVPTPSPVASADQDIWARALETGQVPLMTQTPTVEHRSSTPLRSETPAIGTIDPAAASVAVPPTTQPITAARTHKVQRGETLSSISAAAYGSPNHYPQILKANPNLDPAKLRPGMTINLPDVSETKATSSTPVAAGTTPVPSASHAALDPAKSYSVETGDSLHKIAAKLYGKAEMWSKIYDLNKQAIGPDPARLKLHMVLSLPEAPTAGTTH